jgi:hypothetical protein
MDCRFPLQFSQAICPAAGSRGQEALEQEAVGGKPRGTECSNGRAGTRDGVDSEPPVLHLPDQAVAGVGNQWCTGIRYQRHAAPRFQAIGETRQGALVTVVVIGQGRGIDAEVPQQAQAVAGVFGSNQVHPLKHFQCPLRHITEIAYGCRHNIQTAIHFFPL